MRRPGLFFGAMMSKGATLLVFLGIAAAVLALGSVALAAGIKAAEGERNGHARLPRM